MSPRDSFLPRRGEETPEANEVGQAEETREVGQVDPQAQPVEPPAEPPAERAEQVPNPATTVLDRPPLAQVGEEMAREAEANPIRMYPDPDSADSESEEG